MKTKNSINSLNDIIFENRNKLYGAYELRTQYNSRVTRALIITLTSSVILFFFVYMIKPKKHDGGILETKNDSIIFSDFTGFKTNPQKPISERNRFDKPTGKPDEHAFQAVTDTTTKQLIDTTSNQQLASNDTSSGNPFSSQGNTDSIPLSVNQGNSILIYNQAVVDKSPLFPGGMEKFYKYLRKNIRYTDAARQAKLEAKLYIRFIIDEEGFIRKVTVMNKVGFGIDEAVEKVLLNSPMWTPGILKNEPVKTEMVLPVSFSMAQ